MDPKKFLLPLLLLAAASLACGVNITLPKTEVKTGPTITEPIHIPNVDGAADLKLSIGGGKLTLTPGAASALVEGTATYNVADFKPAIKTDGASVSLEQGSLEINGVPSFSEEVINEWNLALGTAPMILRINGGAYQASYDLGGLALQNLTIKDGAADVKLTFSRPNQAEMGLFDYQTGASSVRMSQLANANFASMVFQAGLGNYVLDFSGVLQRSANVKITAGLSNLTLIVPAGVDAKVTVTEGLSNIDTSGQWTKTGDTYTQPGNGPTLTITIDIGGGKLTLSNTP